MHFTTIFDVVWYLFAIISGSVALTFKVLRTSAEYSLNAAAVTFNVGVVVKDVAVYINSIATSFNVAMLIISMMFVLIVWNQNYALRMSVKEFVIKCFRVVAPYAHAALSLETLFLAAVSVASVQYIAQGEIDPIAMFAIASIHTFRPLFGADVVAPADVVRTKEDVLPQFTRMSFEENGATVYGFRSNDGKVYVESRKELIQREMATNAAVLKVEQPDFVFAVGKYNDDYQMIMLGGGSLVSTDKAVYCVSAFHLFDEPNTQYYAVKDRQAYQLDLSDAVRVGDLIYWTPHNNFRSTLGLRAKEMDTIRMGRPVTLYDSRDNINWNSSTGIISRDPPAKGKFEWYSSYSSDHGSSGFPVLQDKKVVGVHSGANVGLGKNIFLSLRLLLKPRAYNAASGKIIVNESSVENDKDREFWLEEDKDFEEILGMRGTAKALDNLRDEDKRDMLEVAMDLWDSDKRMYREYEAELMEVERQGYTVGSKEVGAVKAKYRNRIREKSSHYVLLDASAHVADFQRGRAQLPLKQGKEVHLLNPTLVNQALASFSGVTMEKNNKKKLMETDKPKGVEQEKISPKTTSEMTKTSPSAIQPKSTCMTTVTQQSVMSEESIKLVQQRVEDQEKELKNLRELIQSLMPTTGAPTAQKKSTKSSNITKKE